MLGAGPVKLEPVKLGPLKLGPLKFKIRTRLYRYWQLDLLGFGAKAAAGTSKRDMA